MASLVEKESKDLYQEFVLYMKNNHSKNLSANIEIHYKHLHSELCKQNKHKRKNIIECLKNRELRLKTQAAGINLQEEQKETTLNTFINRRNKSACNIARRNIFSNARGESSAASTFLKGSAKFRKIQTVRDYEEFKSVMIRSESPSLFNGFRTSEQLQDNTISDRILLEEHQQKQLHTDISNYKTSIGQLRKDLLQIKCQIKKIQIKENKFQEAFHLAQNINQHTQQVSLANSRNYQKMLKDQEETVSNLKKAKTKVKKQLQQTQKEYHRRKIQHSVKMGKFLNTFQPMMIQNKNTLSFVNFHPNNTKNSIPLLTNNTLQYKEHIKFIIHLESLLKLLKDHEGDYEELKQLYCTRIPSRRINTVAFSSERIQWIQAIQKFESMYEIRVESSFKIIHRIFCKVKEDNQQLQKTIFQKQMIRNQLIEEAKQYEEKIEEYRTGIDDNQNSGDYYKQEENTDRQLLVVSSNSKIFIMTIELIGSMLVKFQHIFKLFFMMNVDKKKFNEHLHSLETILRNKNYTMTPTASFTTINQQFLAQQQLSYPNYCSPSHIAHQSINLTQVKNIILDSLFKKPEIKSSWSSDKSLILQQFLMILFNDIRIPINCRRNLIIEEVNFCEFNENWEECIAKILTNVREECEYTYVEKFRNLSESLMQCMRCIKKMKNTNIIGQKSLFETQDPLTSINPKVKLPEQNFEEEDEQTCDVDVLGKALLSYLSSKSDRLLDRPPVWKDNAKKNPSQMVRQLHELRNQKSKKFTILNFSVNKNQFIPKQISIRNFMKQPVQADPKTQHLLPQNSRHPISNFSKKHRITDQTADEALFSISKNDKKPLKTSKITKRIEFNLGDKENFIVQ